MAYCPRKRSKAESKRKSLSNVEPEDQKTITARDFPALRRKRTMALNRMKSIHLAAMKAMSDETEIDTFVAYYSTLPKICENFEDAHLDILSVIETENEEQEDDVRVLFDDLYFRIETIYKKMFPPNIESTRKSDQSHSSTSNVKFPKIQIGSFSGCIKDWPKFYDLFNSLIHENKTFSDTERMHFLITCLSGDALALIRTYPAQGCFYHDAYQTLISRYQNNRELAFTCWREILNLNLKQNSPLEFRRALDLASENLTILKGLGLPTDQWDFVLCYHILSKLDSQTRCAFEKDNTCSELPKLKELLGFLQSKCEALIRDTHFSSPNRSFTNRAQEKSSAQPKSSKAVKSTSVFLSNTIESKQRSPTVNPVPQSHASKSQSSAVEAPVPSVVKCSFCSDNHAISQCKKFEQLPISERIEYAKNHHWCFNCLKPSHQVKDCRSLFKCRKCRQRHHTLVHQDGTSPSPSSQPFSGCQTDNPVRVLTNLGDGSVVLLSTAIVQIRDSSGNFQSFRALIDSGSQAHFVTERAAERLGALRNLTSRRVRGLGQSTSTVTGSVRLEIGTNGQSLFIVDALTLPSICCKMPSARIDKSCYEHLQDLTLADPDFNKPGPIDLLLGAEIFASLLRPGSISGGSQQPSALNSVFGWILIGSVGSKGEEVQAFFVKEDDLLHEEVKRLWELDSFDSQKCFLTPDEEKCEEIFATHHTRDSNGRYVVPLPFKDDDTHPSFRGSRDIALRCFHAIERKLVKDPALQKQYNEFMKDYLDSGHMTLVSGKDLHAETPDEMKKEDNVYTEMKSTRDDAALLSQYTDEEYMKLEDQSGKAVNIPASERRALLVGLTLHERGRAAAKLQDYTLALVLLLEADRQLSECSSAILKSVDNWAVLQLDVAWCYLCLQNLSSATDAAARLARAEDSLKKLYGEHYQRMAELKGTVATERVLLMRLYLLQGIVAYHQNKRTEAKALLEKAESELNFLRVDETAVSSLMELGWSRRAARGGLRAARGDLDQAHHYLADRHAAREEARDKHRRERQQRKLGVCVDGSPVKEQLIEALVTMGYHRRVATAALKNSNNHVAEAVRIIQEEPELLQESESSSEETESPSSEDSLVEVDNKLVSELEAMGYAIEDAKTALKMSRNHISGAIDILVAGGGHVDDGTVTDPSTSAASPSKKKHKKHKNNKNKEECELALQRLSSAIRPEDDDHLDSSLEQEEEFLLQYKSLL